MAWYDHRGFVAWELKAVPKQKLHHARRLYSNGQYVDNAIAPEDLENHIHHQRDCFSSQALFIDGRCVQCGELEWEQCQQQLQLLETYILPFKEPTRPYR